MPHKSTKFLNNSKYIFGETHMNEAINVQIVSKGRFADKVVDAHHREVGFVQSGYIYRFAESKEDKNKKDDKKKGIAWFRMQKTDEIGKDKRKYLLFFGDETEPCAYVDTYNDVYDIAGGNYVCSIEHNTLLMLLTVFLLALILTISIAVFFTGDILLQTAYWTDDIDSVYLSITDDDQEWDGDAAVTELDIFGINETITDDDGNIIETKRKDKIIYPGLEGEYQFKIENVSNMALFYDPSFMDVNEFDIPMRFKLKQGNDYIVGSQEEWATIDELKVETQKLMPERKHLYTLEWKWLELDDQKDTEIGMEELAQYEFTININFRSAY